MTKFGTIIADPPWEYAVTSGKIYRPVLDDDGKPVLGDDGNEKQEKQLSGYSDQKYLPLSTGDLCKLDVKSCAADSSVLLLWTTFPHIPNALKVMQAWGYEYKTGLGWGKTTKDGKQLSFGVGYWFRGCIELVLVGKRGKKSYRTNVRGGHLSHPEGHSIKPDFLHELAEKHFPEPRLEMFGRRERDGWTVIGNEAPGHKGEDIKDALLRLAGE